MNESKTAYIFIDESQDFREGFIEFCKRILGKTFTESESDLPGLYCSACTITADERDTGICVSY